MSNDLTRQDDDDDGFSGSVNSGRLNKGAFLKWTDQGGWIDRDGLTPASSLLVLAVDTALQRWKNDKPETIRTKPLPDPDDLNGSIPRSEWEKGVDNKLRAPWAHIVVVYFVNPATGEIYTYSSPTTDAHIAYDNLKEAVVTMRALRGVRCMPLIRLAERAMKTNFGMRKRPHFEIVGWKTSGGDDGGGQDLPKPATPQLTGPAAPAKTASTYQPKPKPPIDLSVETLETMSDVKNPTTSEVMGDDSVPW